MVECSKGQVYDNGEVIDQQRKKKTQYPQALWYCAYSTHSPQRHSISAVCILCGLLYLLECFQFQITGKHKPECLRQLRGLTSLYNRKISRGKSAFRCLIEKLVMLSSLGFVSLHFSWFLFYISSLALSPGHGGFVWCLYYLDPYPVFEDLKLESASLEPCRS